MRHLASDARLDVSGGLLCSSIAAASTGRCGLHLGCALLRGWEWEQLRNGSFFHSSSILLE